MNEELQELMQSNPEWYKELQYQDVKIYIKDNINSASRSFVAIGYYLKYVRDNELFSEDGYTTIWEFAQGEFSIGKSSASRFMAINDRFSKDGNSPILLEQYKNFSSSKLSEMLTMSDEQLDRVSVATTRAEIREMKQPAKEEGVAPAQQEPGTEKESNWEEGVFENDGQAYGWMRSEVVKALFKSLYNGHLEVNCLGVGVSGAHIQVMAYEYFVELMLDYFYFQCTNGKDKFKANHQRIKEEFEWYKSSQTKDVIDVDEKGCPNCNYNDMTMDELDAMGFEGNYPCNICDDKLDQWIPKHEPDPVEKVEADIIETECEDNDDEDEPEIIDPEHYTYRDVDDELDKLMEYVEAFREDNSIVPGRRKAKMRLDAIILLDKEMKKLPASEEPKPEQPDLPLLKNNDQRKDFIDAYATWPIWIDQELTGERYYRYDFDNGESFVIRVSLCRKYLGWDKGYSKELTYGREEYFILKKDLPFVESGASKSMMVDYLKDFQKKGG